MCDSEISIEEVEHTLIRLKLKKACGQCVTVSELGGQILVLWLKQIFNAIVEMKVTQQVLSIPSLYQY